MEILFKKSDSLNNLDLYLNLYNQCFDDSKFKLIYLNWLYNKNPSGNFLGIDCFDGDDLIGQVGGIPFEYVLNKKNVKIILALNVCLIKKYRKKGYFSDMTKKFEQLVKENNYDGIIGISNKSATPTWIKSISMINLFQLEVFLGFGEIKNSNFSTEEFCFYSCWNNETINWRLNNPNNKIYVNKNSTEINSVYSKTKYPIIKAHAPLAFYKKKILENNYQASSLKPFIFIGKIGKLKNKNVINLPEFLKPAPLNFIYKFFDINISLKEGEIFLTFLDFDIF